MEFMKNNCKSKFTTVLNCDLNSFKKVKLDDGYSIYVKGSPMYKGQLIDLSLPDFKFIIDDLGDLSKESVSNFTVKISGNYCFVVEKENQIFVLSDIIRTFPVFYLVTNHNVIVSDVLSSFSDCRIAPKNVSGFITSGYNFGNATIYENVKSLQAAEFLTIDTSKFQTSSFRYYKFLPSLQAREISLDSFVKKYNKTMELIIKRIITSAPNCRQWIVPLSGGHDSRQIINALYKLRVKNVICFTYGKINNNQSILSKKVAEALGYDWHFVEYTEEKWATLHIDGAIDRYIDFAFQGNSIPHLQDFLAINELMQKNIIRKDDVILPGHTLDMIAGGHLSNLDLDCYDKESSLDRTILRHGKMRNKHSLRLFENFNELSSIYDQINIHPTQFQEYINWQERQAKFIVNSCRIYEYFGLEFRLPFWERDFVELFLSLPNNQRLGRRFYLSAEKEGILVPELTEIPFEDELNSKKQKKTINQKIRSKIPTNIRALMSRFIDSKYYEGESLNQIFALKGDTVEEVVGSLQIFPQDTHKFLKPHLIRYTYRTDNELLTGLYAISRILKKSK